MQFTVPGAARGKGRPRFAAGRTYTDPETASFENLIKVEAQRAMTGRPPFEGPLHVKLSVLKLIPASWSKKRTEAADWCTGRPDLDNIAKIFKDAMNKVVYRDDAQVAKLTAQKRYGAVEMTLVVIEELAP